MIEMRLDEFKKQIENVKEKVISELNEQKINSVAELELASRSKEKSQDFLNLFVNEVDQLDILRMKTFAEQCKSSSTKKNVMKYLEGFQELHPPPKLNYVIRHLFGKLKSKLKTIVKENTKKIKLIDERKQPKKKNFIQRVGNAIADFVTQSEEHENEFSKLSKQEWKQYKDKQKDYVIQNAVNSFVKAYEEKLDEYKGYQFDYLDINNIKKEQISDIIHKYKTEQIEEEKTLYKEFIALQQNNMASSTRKPVATLMHLFHSKLYELHYTVPQKIPPTFEMKFVSVDLKSLEDEDEIKVNVMKNMKYEM
eukprot:329934_1